MYTHPPLYLLYIQIITIADRTPCIYSQIWLIIEH